MELCESACCESLLSSANHPGKLSSWRIGTVGGQAWFPVITGADSLAVLARLELDRLGQSESRF